MPENKESIVKTPKYYQMIDGAVPFCLNCGSKFVEPVAANYDYVCPACNHPFNVVKEPAIQSWWSSPHKEGSSWNARWYWG